MEKYIYRPVRFYLITFACTWFWWLFAILINEGTGLYLGMFLGLVSPAVVAVVTVFTSKNKALINELLFEDDIPVATCRFFFSVERDCYVIGRIAVSKEFRGKQYGKKMLQGAEKTVSDLGGKRIELSAQCRVAEFYKKQGYMELNDIHMDEDCPHTWMRKEV